MIIFIIQSICNIQRSSSSAPSTTVQMQRLYCTSYSAKSELLFSQNIETKSWNIDVSAVKVQYIFVSKLTFKFPLKGWEYELLQYIPEWVPLSIPSKWPASLLRTVVVSPLWWSVQTKKRLLLAKILKITEPSLKAETSAVGLSSLKGTYGSEWTLDSSRNQHSPGCNAESSYRCVNQHLFFFVIHRNHHQSLQCPEWKKPGAWCRTSAPVQSIQLCYSL